MLNAVLFDLDNTLVDRDRAFHECVHAHFRDPAVRRELFRLDQGGRGAREPLFSFWEQHAGKPMNQATFGRLLAQRLQPDRRLLQALRILARRVKLGIITNGSGETQRLKFHAAGLAEVIPLHHLWVSGELGNAKPDPAIFLLACRALAESPEHCLFIGDQEQDDQAGAAAAGMRARRVHTVLNAERLGDLLRQEQMQ
jgi:HAD superfamily hydrolase (TIGR01509 family)